MFSKNIILFLILPAVAYGLFVQDCCPKKNVKFLLKEGSGRNCSEFDNAKPNLKDPEEGKLPDNNHLRCRVSLCDDGKRPVNGLSCGIGKCNLVGCKCEGGCIKGNAVKEFTKKHGAFVDAIHQEGIDKMVDKAMKALHMTS